MLSIVTFVPIHSAQLKNCLNRHNNIEINVIYVVFIIDNQEKNSSTQNNSNQWQSIS
jgi:GT2 family glycosyltransferase